jgi:methyl-accepting chemotaxis protein
MSILGSLRNRLVGGLGVLLLLFLGLAIAAVGSLRTINQVVAEELELLAGGSGLTTTLVGSVADQIRAGEAYVTTPSAALAQDFLRFGDSSHAGRRAIRLLPGLTAEDQSALNRMEVSQARMEVAYALAHAWRDLGNADSAAAFARAARGPADTLIQDLRALTARQQDRVTTRIERLRDQADRRQQVIWLLLATGIIMGAVTAYLTVRTVNRPLGDLIEAARRFGEGDLRPLGLAAMPEELAVLGRTMTTMGTRLRGLIDRVIREAGAIGLSASDLSAMSQELAAGSQEISQAIGGVTSSADRQVRDVQAADGVITSWNATTARDSGTAKRIVADGERIRALAEDEGRDLAGTSRLLASLRQSAQTAGGQVRNASRQVGAVNELLDLAHQLAAQSEVLALNAAVEAARAGAHGDGMAAIAAESRRLTDTSRVAATRIGEGIAALHERIGVLDRSIQSVARQAFEAESAAQQGTVVLGEIARAAATIRDGADQVARASGESRAIAGRVAALRAQLESDARQNVAAGEAVTAAPATGEIATSAAGLLEASERLAALVAEFRV